ncbi:hypothetical protein U9M48_020300 [Paspalum notatum var. saurae]|uniref:Uncharacterized protein n=1 Tax=Paspalum notatum var. saurae TaxID=547442 RepID=A0AAQ3WS35_PASNO
MRWPLCRADGADGRCRVRPRRRGDMASSEQSGERTALGDLTNSIITDHEDAKRKQNKTTTSSEDRCAASFCARCMKINDHLPSMATFLTKASVWISWSSCIS